MKNLQNLFAALAAILFTSGCMTTVGGSSDEGRAMPDLNDLPEVSDDDDMSDSDSGDDDDDASDDDDDDDTEGEEPECANQEFDVSRFLYHDSDEVTVCSYVIAETRTNDTTVDGDGTVEYNFRLQGVGESSTVLRIGIAVTANDNWLNELEDVYMELDGVDAEDSSAAYGWGSQLYYSFSAENEWFEDGGWNMPAFEIDGDEEMDLTFHFDLDGEAEAGDEVEIQIYQLTVLTSDGWVIDLTRGQTDDHIVFLDNGEDFDVTSDGSGSSGDDEDDDMPDDEDDTPSGDEEHDFSFYYNAPGSTSYEMDVMVTVIMPNDDVPVWYETLDPFNGNTVTIDDGDVPEFEDLPEDAEVLVSISLDDGDEGYGCMGSSINGSVTGYWPNTAGTEACPISNNSGGCEIYFKMGDTSCPSFGYHPLD